MVRGLVLDIGMEVDWGNGDDEIFDLFRMQSGVARRKDAAFADAEQRDLVMAGFLRDAVDCGIDVVIDVIINFQPSLGRPGWPQSISQRSSPFERRLRTSERSGCKSAMVYRPIRP